ncbi:MAG: hypothetical protein ACK5LK_01030 [Chthoniobacterales bacterium]
MAASPFTNPALTRALHDSLSESQYGETNHGCRHVFLGNVQLTTVPLLVWLTLIPVPAMGVNRRRRAARIRFHDSAAIPLIAEKRIAVHRPRPCAN